MCYSILDEIVDTAVSNTTKLAGAAFEFVARGLGTIESLPISPVTASPSDIPRAAVALGG
jgi:hypothetical protein